MGTYSYESKQTPARNLELGDREEDVGEASTHSPLNRRAAGLAACPNQSWLRDTAAVVSKSTAAGRSDFRPGGQDGVGM